MVEELKLMDIDKESIVELKFLEMFMQEDCISDIVSMQIDEQINKEQFVLGSNEKFLYIVELVILEDLQLFVDLFYFFYEYGFKGVQMLREFQWFRVNSSVVSVNCKGKDSEKVSMFDLFIFVVWMGFFVDDMEEVLNEFIGNWQKIDYILECVL